MAYDLPDFVTPIPSGMEPCTESDGRLPREVERKVQEQLDAFDRARAKALVSSQFYIVH